MYYAVQYWIGSKHRVVNPQTTGPLGDAGDSKEAAATARDFRERGFIAEVVLSDYVPPRTSRSHGGEKLSIHGRRH